MIVIGAKGLAKELLTVLEWNGNLGDVFFFDNINADTPDLLFDKFPVIKSWESLEEHFRLRCRDFAIGVGGAQNRKHLTQKATSIGGNPCSIISNHALIGNYGNTLRSGVCVMSRASISCDVEIGHATLIDTAAIISHDVRIGDYCQISPGAKLLGRTTIGEGTEIGSNAVVLPGIQVRIECKVGAGAVVTRDVVNGSVVVGIPSRPITKVID